MSPEELNRIKNKKKADYNIYGINGKLFAVIAGLWLALVVDCVLFIAIKGFPPAFIIGVDLVIILALVLYFLLSERKKKGKVEEYRRVDGFRFLGLYNLALEKNLDSGDIISRKKEAAYIRQTLEELIFAQSHVKQVVCLTGKSGCGKSTILSFFKSEYGEDYVIYELTDNYLDFRLNLENLFPDGIEKGINTLTTVQNKKLVFIMDQFERYFFLNEEKKSDVRELIHELSKKNTAIIVSMREEYLAGFMKEFNVNNLMKAGRAKDAESENGIINDLISTIKDMGNKHRMRQPFHDADKHDKWWNLGLIKANQFVHIESVGSKLEDPVTEKVGNTIFYCENQNSGDFAQSVLQSRCETVFGEAGTRFYEKHKDKALVEQQIFYNMAEYERKIKRVSMEELEELFRMEGYELMNRYYDIQLCATDDYLSAAKVLYMLSYARQNNVVMKYEDIEFGLMSDLFYKNGHKTVPDLMKRLEEMQLIRRNIKDSSTGFEVAHDFIAASFINYGNSNIDRNVRGALDLYMAEYLDPNGKEAMQEKRDHVRTVMKSSFYKNMAVIFAVINAILGIVVTFVYDPWRDVFSSWNFYGDWKSLFTLLIGELSLLYIFHIYHKIYRFCHGRQEKVCKVIFTIIMLGVTGGVLCYPFEMLFIGLFVAVAGLNGVFLLDSHYRKSCRAALKSYGIKCSVVGFGFVVFHVVMCLFNTAIPHYLIFVEMVMICMLLGYGYIAHMNKEHLYGRNMDAGSARLTSEMN